MARLCGLCGHVYIVHLHWHLLRLYGEITGRIGLPDGRPQYVVHTYSIITGGEFYIGYYAAGAANRSLFLWHTVSVRVVGCHSDGFRYVHILSTRLP